MMTWNLLAIKTCGYHLKCWTQETQFPPTHTDTYIHVCEYRYICVKTEAYVRYFPCLADLSLPAMPPIFGIGLHKMAGPLCPFRLTDIHNHLTTYRFFPHVRPVTIPMKPHGFKVQPPINTQPIPALIEQISIEGNKKSPRGSWKFWSLRGKT